MFRHRSGWVTVSVGLIQERQSALNDHLGNHSKISKKNRLGESNEAKL